MEDKELLYRSLIMWRNYIQTGDVNLSTQDLVNCGDTKDVRMLNIDQQEFVIRLEELAKEQL